MKIKDRYKNDIAIIMSKRYANGSDLWAGEDNNIGKGSPFSTRDVALILTELGYTKKDKIIKDIAELIFKHQQQDGRFRISKSGAIYPCHTIGCLRVLCYLGYSKDKRLKKTFEHLLSTQENDGGWKCNKFSFGKGPETYHSNPGPTLEALDTFRFIDISENKQQINKAVEFLLWHWEHKKPVGPCLFGIGTLFNKTEFPFSRYNLFYYTFVLSFYKKANGDKRLKEAFKLLENKLQDDKMIVENPNRQLAKMDFCFKGRTSELATKRFNEIKNNMQ
ncbi:MAG: prenyltransferase [Saprospiraceae bacterium]|nr:prenyltransferase [Saprospiraceae bacterium]